MRTACKAWLYNVFGMFALLKSRQSYTLMTIGMYEIKEIEMSNFTPSKYQQAIFDFVATGRGHGLIDAVPGSGKTTTLVEAAKLLPATCVAIFLAFNKHIATELNNRLKAQGSPMQAMTIHSLGLQALRALPVKVSIDDKKYRLLCKDYLLAKQSYDYQLQQVLQKLVSFAQLTLSQTDEESLWALVDHFGIDQITRRDKEWPVIWQGVRQILDAGIEQAKKYGSVDFNDMVWLPTVLNLTPAKCDWMFVDECQDLNAAQLELVIRSVNGHGRLLFVGDKRQSLYGFAGADTESVENIVKRTGATVLPLSICYRCPKSHIDLCARIFAGIEARSDAPEGMIEHVKPEALSDTVRPGDLVLCRTTAPLIETCLRLLREGVRAKVRGRDIGKNFVDLINKLRKQYPALVISKLSETLGDYRQQQAVIIGVGEDSEMKLAALDDKVDTMQALLHAYMEEHCETASFDGFCIYIEGFFSDELGPVVTLSTVHKAKGLEESRVFILKPELMPFPKAKLGWQMEQELNIKYVAFSRSKSELYFVDYAKVEPQEPEQPALIEEEDEIEPAIEVPALAEAINELIEAVEEKHSNAGRPKIKEKLVSFKFESDTIAFLNSLEKGTKTDFIEKLIQASADYARWQKGQTDASNLADCHC